jgi:hypothetical protein
MTIGEIFETLATRGAFTASRVKDIRTAVKVLTTALGPESPAQCPGDPAGLDLVPWAAALEDHWRLEDAKRTAQNKAPVSAASRRNTRNNLRLLLREAKTHGLLTPPVVVPLRARKHRLTWIREQRETSPYKGTFDRRGRQRYRLRQDQWPPDVAQGWQTYRTTCDLEHPVRETTFRKNAASLELYFGFIATILDRPPVWQDTFDVVTVSAFVRWHAARHQRTTTVSGRMLAIIATAIAHVLQHPAHPRLYAYSKKLKLPDSMHDKEELIFPLATIEAVADALLAEGRLPLINTSHTKYPGALRAVSFECGLMLKILARMPMRQRNLREMQFGRHLTHRGGHWRIRFAEGDLKVGDRGGKPNVYAFDISQRFPDLPDILEEWRTVHRPKLPHAANDTHVFLTRNGTPYADKTLHNLLSTVVGIRSGKRFYPHLIRSIWATEAVKAGVPLHAIAEMLGDLPATVHKSYYSGKREEHIAVGASFFYQAIGKPSPQAAG